MKHRILLLLAIFLAFSCTIPEETSDIPSVDAPVFSPDPGSYDTTQNVTISCSTEGAEIYYTIDGADPTADSTLYSAGISVSSTTRIKAIAVKEGMKDSEIVKGDYIFYVLAWSDEFNDGVFDTDVWTRQIMLNPYNQELETYTGDASTAYEENGYMVLEATYNNTGTYDQPHDYTSARIISNPGGDPYKSNNTTATGKTFLYGKISARIQLPGGKGIWSAFWMLGDNISETGGDTNWPQCGEIDILESGAIGDPNYGAGTVHGTIHRDPGSESNPVGYNEYISAGSYTLPGGALFNEDYHIFDIEWTETTITWKVDGITFGTKDISDMSVEDEFHKPFYVIFNIAVGGWFTDTPDGTTTFPQRMYIDWIRYYEP